MTTITLVRTDKALPPEPVLEQVRGFLFGVIDGAHKDDKRAWRRFWGRLIRLEPGEMAEAEMIFPRNYRFHRKFFALLNLGFESWEPTRKRKSYRGMLIEKNFDQFREDITILSGFYTQTFDLNGRMTLRAKSISFSNMDDDEFSRVYSSVADVLLRNVLTTYSGRDELDSVVDRIIGFL